MASGNGRKPELPPTVPQGVGDLSQPTAQETTKAAAEAPMSGDERQREQMRSLVEHDMQRDRDERFRFDPGEDETQRMRGARADRDGRDDDLDIVRGGDRSYSNDDWDRSMGPTDPERRRMIRRMFEDSVLPQLPLRAGWRRCWVSTTHNYDTPQFRVGLGYHFVHYEDLAREGWAVDQYAVKDARNVYANCVMWREMIAMETDERNWYAIMRELHHDMPYELSRGIYDTLDAAGERVRDAGGRTTMAPGMEQLRTYTRPPRQFH